MIRLQHPHSILTCSRCQNKRVVFHCIVYLPDGGTLVNPGHDPGCRWCAAMEECNIAGDIPMEEAQKMKSRKKVGRR